MMILHDDFTVKKAKNISHQMSLNSFDGLTGMYSTGVEPTTFGSVDQRSIQLSYEYMTSVRFGHAKNLHNEQPT
jgi:hypothetical protein